MEAKAVVHGAKDPLVIRRIQAVLKLTHSFDRYVERLEARRLGVRLEQGSHEEAGDEHRE